jgi:hypothetical protein
MNQTYLNLLGLTIDTEAPMAQTVANCSHQASVRAGYGQPVSVSFDVTAGHLYCINITDAKSQYHLKYMGYGATLTDVIQLVDQRASQIWGR